MDDPLSLQETWAEHFCSLDKSLTLLLRGFFGYTYCTDNGAAFMEYHTKNAHWSSIRGGGGGGGVCFKTAPPEPWLLNMDNEKGAARSASRRRLAVDFATTIKMQQSIYL